MIVSGFPNKNYSQGMKIGDMWEEVFRRSGKENSAMNAIHSYTGNRFNPFIDLRSVNDNDRHGSGLRFVNTKDALTISPIVVSTASTTTETVKPYL